MIIEIKLEIIEREFSFEYQDKQYTYKKHAIERNKNLLLVPCEANCFDGANHNIFDLTQVKNFNFF